MEIIVRLSSRHKEKCPKSTDLGHFLGCGGGTLNSFSRSDTAKAKLLRLNFFLCFAYILCNIRDFVLSLIPHLQLFRRLPSQSNKKAAPRGTTFLFGCGGRT